MDYSIYMQVLGYIFLVLTFLFESISHGLQYKVRYTQITQKKREKFGKLWHSANSLFIMLIAVSSAILFLCEIGRYDPLMVRYAGTLEMWLDIGFILLTVASFRFFLFAPLRNLFAGQRILYTGTSANGDSFYKKRLIKIFPPTFLFLLRVWGFVTYSFYLFS